MKLFFLEKYAQEIVEATSKNEFRTEDKQWIDLCFENEIYRLYDQCVTSYNCIMYRNALKYGFYDFMLLKDKYRHYCGPRQVHLTSIMLWLELQVVLLSPIAPHICEYIWKEHLKKPKLLSQTPYIQLYKNGTHNIILHRQYNYFNSIYEEFRSIRDKTVHSKNSKLTAHDSIHGIIYVAKNYAPWQQLVLKHLQQVPLAPCQRKPLDNQYINEIRQNADFCKLDKKQAKQLLPFTTYKMKVICGLSTTPESTLTFHLLHS
jgi:leucyl-tRNA synthetase